MRKIATATKTVKVSVRDAKEGTIIKCPWCGTEINIYWDGDFDDVVYNGCDHLTGHDWIETNMQGFELPEDSKKIVFYFSKEVSEEEAEKLEQEGVPIYY